jgi:hypothetical protein
MIDPSLSRLKTIPTDVEPFVNSGFAHALIM